MDLAKVGVRVDAEGVNKFVHDMNSASDEFNSFGAKAERAGESLKSRFTAPLVDFGKAAFFAASDAGESISKLGVVFGDSASQVEEFAQGAADSIGLSAQSARSAAGDFGNLFVTMGVGASDLGFDIGKLAGDISGLSADMLNSADPAVALSESMTALAGDLTSFTNIPIDQSLSAIQSGLIGEFEPLRKFGVLLDADAIKAKAMELGLVGANGELSNQAKVAATTALILEQTASAHGDQARTADSAANSYRRFQNRLADFKETIGTQLLPIGTQLINWGLKLTDVLEGLSPTALKIVVVIGGLVAAIGPALVYLAKFIEAWRVVQSLFAAQAAASAASGAASGGIFAGMLGPIGLVIIALVALGAAYKTNFLGFADAVNKIGKVIADVFGRIVDWFGKFFDAIDRVQSGSSAAEKTLSRLPGPLRIIAEWIGTAVRAVRLFFEALGEIGSGSDRFVKVLHQLPGPLQEVVKFIDKLVTTFSDLRKKGLDPISAAFGAVSKALRGIGGEKTPGWIVKLADILEKTSKYIRLFIEGLTKLGSDSQRVHKILNVLPEPLQKLFLVFARVIQMVQTFRKTWTEFGALAAFRTLPRSFELLGRTIGNLIESVTGFTNFSREFKRFFEDIGDLIGSVVELVDDLIHGRWSEAWDDFLNILKNIGTLAIDYFRMSLGLWKDVLGLLIDAFKAIDWDKVADLLIEGITFALKTYFVTIPELLIAGFRAIPWDAIFAAALNLANLLLAKGAELIGGLLRGAQEFLTSDVIPFLLRIGSDILAAMPGLLTTLAQKGVEIITGFLNGARDFITNDVVPFFRDIITTALDQLPAIGDFLGSLAEHGTNLIKGLYNAAFSFWDEHLRPFFEKFITRILKNLPSVDEFVDSIKWIADKILGGLRDKLPKVFDAVEGVGSFFADILHKIIDKLPAGNEVWKGLQFLADEILGGIREKLDTVFDAVGGVGEFFKDIVSSIASLIPDNFDDVISKFGSITDVLKKFVEPLEWIVNNAGKVKDFIGGLIPGGGDGKKKPDETGDTGTTTDTGNVGTIADQVATFTVNFSGAQALRDISQWVQDVLDTIAPLGSFLDFGNTAQSSLGAVPIGGGSVIGGAGKAHPKAFDGKEFYNKVTAWVADVTSQITNTRDRLTDYVIFPSSGGGSVGRIAKVVPYPFDGSTFLRNVTHWVTDIADEYKRLNLSSTEQVRALLANMQIQFGAIKKEITDKTFETRNAAANQFVGMRDDLVRLATDIRAKVGGSDKLGKGQFYEMKNDIESIIRALGNSVGGETWTFNVKSKIVARAFETRNAVVNEFVGMRNDISQILGSMRERIGDAIGNWREYARSRAYSVGFAIGDGLYWGMDAWVDAIASKAASLVHTAVNAANNAAGNPKSPAPVTIPLGKALAQGLDFGMFLEQPNVNSRFASLVSSAVGQNLVNNSGINGTLIGGGGDTYNMFLLSSDELVRLQQGAEAGLGLNDSLFRETNLRLQGTGGIR